MSIQVSISPTEGEGQLVVGKSVTFSSLVTGRADVYLKVGFARSLLAGVKSWFDQAVYLDHIYCWNKFTEEVPRKQGPAEFLNAFRELAKSFLLSGGLNPETSEIGVNVGLRGRLTSGSHRTAMALGAAQLNAGETITIPATVDNFATPQWDLDYFAGIGASKYSLRHAALQMLSDHNRGIPKLLLVWPAASGRLEEIITVLQRNGVSTSGTFSFDLEEQALSNLISLTYEAEAWAKNPIHIHSKLREVTTGADSRAVTLILLEPVDDDLLRDVKCQIRDLWNSAFQGVHTTDGLRDSVAVFSTLTCDFSRRHLAATESKAFLSSLQRTKSIRDNYYASFEDPARALLSGSQILNFLAIRQSRDVDFVSIEPEFEVPEGWDSHENYLRVWGLDSYSVISDPSLHVWLFGCKLLAPWRYFEIINQRLELKDFKSRDDLVGLLRGVEESGLGGSWSVGCRLGDKDKLESSPTAVLEFSSLGDMQIRRIEQILNGSSSSLLKLKLGRAKFRILGPLIWGRFGTVRLRSLLKRSRKRIRRFIRRAARFLNAR